MHKIREKFPWYDGVRVDDSEALQRLSGRYSTRESKRVRELLGVSGGGTHMMRKIYGAYSFYKYGAQREVQSLAWLKCVLGHTSSVTSRSYDTVMIKTRIG